MTIECKDYNGRKLNVGDKVKFGEKFITGEVVEVNCDRIKVKVIEYLHGHYAIREWKYIYDFPAIQARKVIEGEEEVKIKEEEIPVKQATVGL